MLLFPSCSPTTFTKLGGPMKKLSVVLISSILIAAFCVASLPDVSSAQEIKLNYSSFFPAPHKNSQLSEQWCKEIEKRTNGKVKITYFPGGTLTPAAQTYD